MEPLLIQPILKGIGEGIFGLSRQEGIVCWSGHRRVRMMNPAGSGASACESHAPSPEICDISERFLKRIQWRGMFMIEMLRTRDGRLWFMELNGRSWGSVALARRMGFEYPAWNARVAIDPDFCPETPAKRDPVICRHLGRELLHVAFVWRGSRSRQSEDWPGRFQTLRQVLHLRRGEFWYNSNKADPDVFWADSIQTVISYVLKLEIVGRAWNRLKRPVNE